MTALVAYEWQHEETGRTGFAGAAEVEDGTFQQLNPRLRVIGPLYGAVVLKALRDLLDTFDRCESGFPPSIEMRFAVRDKARAVLEAAKEQA